MIRKYIIFSLLLGSMFSCRTNSSEMDNKLIHIENIVSAKIPSDASYVEDSSKSIDSYSSVIILKDRDTLQVEFGKVGIIDDLHRERPSIFPLEQKESLEQKAGRSLRSSEVLFSESPERDETENIFDNNYYMYDTLNSGLVGRVVLPKRVKYGMTGIFISRMADSMALSIYGMNLDSSSQRQAVSIFKTIAPLYRKD